MRTFASALVALVVLLAGAGEAHAVTIFQHTGDADPVTEGWNANNGGVAGTPVNDAAFGEPAAWGIDDSGNGFLFYQEVPNAAELAAIATQGWTMTSRLRVASTPTSTATVVFRYSDGVRGYQMSIGSDAAGDPILELDDNATPQGFLTTTLTGLGNGYHDYRLVFDPNAGTASAFVDGTLITTGYTGLVSPSTDALFGAGSSGGVGDGHWASVQFDIGQPVPEPGTMVLVGLGVAAAAAARRRRNAVA